MSKGTSSLKKINLLFFVMLVVLSFSGCGGGTSGTGGNDILARLIEVDGRALANVDVSVLESGQQTVTDEEGKFELRVANDQKSNLLFESERGSAQTELDPAVFPSENVSIEFVAAEDLSVVTVNKIEATQSDSGNGEEKEDNIPRTSRRQGWGSGLTPLGHEIFLRADFQESRHKKVVVVRRLTLTGTIPIGFSANETRLSEVEYLIRLPSGKMCQLTYQNSDGVNGIFKLDLIRSRGVGGKIIEITNIGECENFGNLDLPKGQPIYAFISRITLFGRNTVARFPLEMDRK